ncbi:MAG TPA: S4 domain-containing protein, partial [Candidatus Nitrosotenuis sp.]|nr:S4 domain-containing protein [Candidatus Nitrosotenuis sp.]
KEGATLDDVLNLDIDDLLSRRFQTLVQKKFSFKTPYQARQAIVHGHVTIGDRVITVPSYIVNIKEEGLIQLSPKFKVQSNPPAEAKQEEPEPQPESQS